MERKPCSSDVSDDEWALAAPYLTLMREDALQREHSLPEVFNGLRYIVHTGLQWRNMAHNLLPWHTVYQQTQCWFNAGVFEDMVQHLRMLMREIDDRNPQPRAAILDSRTVPSTSESGGRSGYDGHERRKGSKVYLAVDTLIQVLASRLHKMPNVAIRTQTPAARVQVDSDRVSAVVLESSETIVCNHVISTAPLPLLLDRVTDPPAGYRARLAQVEYLGVICGLFVLSRRLTDSFWVNIDDPAIPRNGIIEYSDLNPDAVADGKTVVYVPLYVHTSLPCFGHQHAVLRADFVQGLQ